MVIGRGEESGSSVTMVDVYVALFVVEMRFERIR